MTVCDTDLTKKSIIFWVITLFIIVTYLVVNTTSNIQKMGSIKGVEEILADLIILIFAISFINWIFQKLH